MKFRGEMIQLRLIPTIVLILFGMGTSYSQVLWTPNGFETDTMACASVSMQIDTIIQHYSDSTHNYYNTGLSRIKSSYIIIKNHQATPNYILGKYRHEFSNAEQTRAIWSETENFIDWKCRPIENLQVAYEENALHITWEVADSVATDTSIFIGKFHIFYAEAEVIHSNLLDSALYWDMTYEDVWPWEVGTNLYEYYFVLPKMVFPAYTSYIRIGVVAEGQRLDKYGYPMMSFYSRVSISPNILNRSLQAPLGVNLK